jgi:hypothetical protein
VPTINPRVLFESGRSADFPGPMQDYLHAAQREWETGEAYGGDSHGGERDHGGPVPYIMHLESVMREAGGWVGGPAKIVEPVDHPWGKWYQVYDGHHRLVAAYMLGLEEIPYIQEGGQSCA